MSDQPPLFFDKRQNGLTALHGMGGDRQFGESLGLDMVHLATLRRHNFEVKYG